MNESTEDPELFRRLPKAELHQHLDGSVSPEFLLQRSEREGFPLPFDTPEGCLRWVRASREGSLENYLQLFAVTLRALQTRSALTEAVRQLAQAWMEDGVRYAEVRFAPDLHTQRGLSMEEVVAAVIEGLLWARRELSIPSALVLCALRHSPRWEHLPPLWRRFRDSGVPLAVDLAGPEAGHPPGPYAELFALAAQEGVPITIHAGEAAGPDSMREALNLGAQRLGHGVRLIEEWAGPERPLTERLRRQRTALELCPSSNLQTRAWEQADTYPLRAYRDAGLCVTINTDNTLISTTTLSREWALVWGGERFQTAGVVQTLLDSYRSAFHPEVRQRSWIERHVLPDLVAVLGPDAEASARQHLQEVSS